MRYAVDIGSGIQKLIRGGFIDAQTAWRSHKPTLGTKVQVPPYATLVFVSLFITPFTLHVSALLIGHLQVGSTRKYTKEPLTSTDPLIQSINNVC
jgi:hypothetical protein